MTLPMLPARPGRCHGVRQIAAFNWPFYALGTPLVLITIAALSLWTLPLPLRTLGWIAAVFGAWYLAASLAVSWIVYDRSALMRGAWLRDVLPAPPARWITIHAGFDEFTPLVRTLFPGTHGRALDIFDPTTMTEPSIVRARRLNTATDAEPAAANALPVAGASIDAALLLLAAHELRASEPRAALFAEVRRTLAPAGRAVVAEHLRGAANFAAFGPGFLHFHSRRTWRRAFAAAGLAIERERSITPFVRVFVLRSAS